ncbi:hypothetical protein GO685_02370 [Wolbachia endosymbiont of Madathamugadia hiepei]|uniref:hypothetical protein n=1 Tax=Wolbachia endosymbiont of Madathamugadia hiepei TaxID=1241303 RepID=UPI00158ADC7C|nr:hypothetical protein [Wolbachia endosymbiont of Madathamugadia hiepei]NUX01354.1 hypothetical protein [Wolbachia endosymbiont of Madathamugadia hiepei]
MDLNQHINNHELTLSNVTIKKVIENLQQHKGDLSNITQFSLRNSDIKNEDLMALIDLLHDKLQNLKWLDLSYNNIGNEGVLALSKAFENGKLQNLRKLYLFSNNIGNEGVLALSKAFENDKLQNLKWLDLSYNNIGNEGALALNEALRERELLRFDLSHNNTENEDIEASRELQNGGELPISFNNNTTNEKETLILLNNWNNVNNNLESSGDNQNNDHPQHVKQIIQKEFHIPEIHPIDSELKKRKLSAKESEQLNYFKNAIVAAKNPGEMHKVVDEAIDIGMRMNGRYENDQSFAEYVVLGMQEHEFKKNDQKKVMQKLMLKGAEFHDHLLKNKPIGEIYKELQPEVQPQIEKQLEEWKKAGANAAQRGSVIGVEIDNKTVFTEYSKDSIIETAKVLEGIDPNIGLGSHIIKVGGGEVEIRKEEGDRRNYTDVLGGFEITFPTSIGGLVITVYHDVKNYDQIQVKVEDTEMLSKLQAKGEEIGKNCLFGGMKIEEAVERGGFPRSGFLSEKKGS